jgi:hypothetical protein
MNLAAEVEIFVIQSDQIYNHIYQDVQLKAHPQQELLLKVMEMELII